MIAIFDARADEFGTLGLGILEPTVCTTSESDGGLWEISLEHPVGDDMRWSLLQQMRILRVPSPMRETPRVEIDTTTVSRAIYKTAVPTKQKLYLRNGPSLNAKRISLHDYGAEVQVLREANEDWSEVITLKGGEHGYMWTRYLEYVRTETETIRNDNPSTIIETHQTRDQLFRISSVETDSAERIVRVKGEHITYDLRGVVVAQEYNPENEPANVAVQRLLEYADHETDFSIYCGSSDPITAEYTGRNLIDCLFNPDDGIVKQAGLRVIRDNFEIYLLPQQERDIQAEIRYGHNMLSTALKTDTSGVVTRIFPYGTDSKGNEVRGSYVDSPHVNDFPIIRAKSIEYDITDVAPADAEDKLEELAKAEFGIVRLNGLDEWCDNLIKTWTDHQSETNAIVNQYITSYNDNTNPIIDALQEKFGDSSATDVATIRQYQTDVSTLLWSRQNGHFSTSEKTWLRNMVAAVDAMSDTCSDVGGTSSGLDAPTVSLDSDFVRLELSPAYTAIANQYALHMYDVVPVRDDEMGVVASAKMTGYEFDCILAQYTKTELGELEDVSTVYGYELATGSVQGTKLITGTVSGNKIQDAAIGYAKINAAAITQLSADSVNAVKATIRDLVAHQITTDQLYVDLATIAIAQITTANIQSANIQWANIQSLVAEIASVATAEIGSAKIGYAQIYDLAADTALIRAGSANNFFFDKLAVTSAQMVDLTVGQLTIRAADENYYALNVDISTGNVTAQQVTVTPAEIAAGKTSTGNHIIDTDLTVSELNTSTAKATEALINKLTAQRIDVAELFALQATINALDSYIIQASTIQALEGQLNVWANDKITLAVDNVKVGGTNLLRYSKKLPNGTSGDTWRCSTGGSFADLTGTDFRYATITQSGASSLTWYWVASPLKLIDADDWRSRKMVCSAYIKSADWSALDSGFQVCLAFTKGGTARLNWYDNYITTNQGQWVTGVTHDSALTNGEWQRFSTVFDLSATPNGTGTMDENTHVYLLFYLPKNGTVNIYAPQLEWGTKATDWSPAPSDADAEYSSIRSEISQTANAINLEVTNIKDSGTNLLLDSKKRVFNGTYNIMRYKLAEDIKVGEQVTLRLWGALGTDKTGFCAYNSGGYVALADPLTDNGDGSFSKTFNWKTVQGTATANNTELWIYVKPSSVSGSSSITAIKLERGDTATDWTPSPLDPQSVGENILPHAKDLASGTTGDVWRLQSGYSWTHNAGSDVVNGPEFMRVQIKNTDGTGNWYYASSPLAYIGSGWDNREITFSGYIMSEDWSAVSMGSFVSLALVPNKETTTRYFWHDRKITNDAAATWSVNAMHIDSLANNKWSWFSVTWKLTESYFTVNGNLSPAPTFANMTYAYVALYLRKYGSIHFYAPKLEWGNKATEWSEVNSSIVNSSLKINDTGIYLSTTGTMQIDADDPAKEARISLGTLMSLDYNGGLQARNGNFTDALSVGGLPVMTSGEISTPIKVATSQPSGHGFLWVKPTSVTSATYTAYTAGSRDATVHFGAANNNPITRSFTASTSSTLANATFTYTLDFDVYCLTDLNQVTGVSFTATATKSGSSVSFGASSAMTMTKYQLEHITLTASSSTNLCTNANAISVAITASASSLTKLFLQSNQYMTLTISNQAGTGTQTCSVYYVN